MTDIASSNGSEPRPRLELVATLELEHDEVRDVLPTSTIILEQAKGAVSARCGITPDDALKVICGLASSQGRDLHEYAAQIVANGGSLG